MYFARCHRNGGAGADGAAHLVGAGTIPMEQSCSVATLQIGDRGMVRCVVSAGIAGMNAASEEASADAAFSLGEPVPHSGIR